ncbi:hypothetical protein [Bradyrhizobium sp. UFLA03-84]|uniref:hypothetical protein n=1 Tax=Bradyrhizobium sp. UFLA03-84 TaxID=418599 RepID=UPI001177ED89|nr:hypothetical protein [Bradyrhizobium sp. UFLA03-84]
MRPVCNIIGFSLPDRDRRDYDTPHDVVRDARLSLAEKRALLASWASDASTVASNPVLRAPKELRSPVPAGEILAALMALYGDPPREPALRRPLLGCLGGKMMDIRLPKQVIARLEESWQSRFNRTARICSATPDHRFERLRAHRNNVRCYRRLLQTQLRTSNAFMQRRLLKKRRQCAV